MFDTGTVLALLQLGDSAYPAGGFAFSWGIEGLAADGHISGRSDLDRFIAEHLTDRWAPMDRVLLVRAFGGVELDHIAGLDRACEALTLSAQMREGSHRAGRALIGIAARLGGARCIAYRREMAEDARLGHLCLVQALVYGDFGMTLAGAELLSGWTLATGLVSAATRLGIIGHVEAQSSLMAARAVLGDLLASPVPEDAEPMSFTPLIDIAVSRGPARHVRMFAT